MQLEEFFDFLALDDIRVKGTRVGIETILWDYLELGLFPEQIATRYSSLSLEAVYATLTYYWHNQSQVETYLRRVEFMIKKQREEQQNNPAPSPVVVRLRTLAAQRNRATVLELVE